MRALVAVGLLLLGLVAACGGGEKPVESLTAEEVVARAYEAMTQTSFAADVPPEPPVPVEGQPPYSIKYGPPDLMLTTGAGYEYAPYSFLVGDVAYGSQTGTAWAYTFSGSSHYERLSNDPRELLRVAFDLQDKGIQELDGKPHRIVTARRDFAKFADLYVTELGLKLKVDIPSACPACEPPCFECSRLLDYELLEEMGYHNPDRDGVNPLGFHLFKGDDIQLALTETSPSWDRVYVTIRGVRELTPELRDELGQVFEALGADPALLDTAEARVNDERDDARQNEQAWATLEVTFWIDPKTFLVSKIEWSSRPGDALRFIDYGNVTLPEPEPAMLSEEVEVLFQVLQGRWRILSMGLEAYAEAHGDLYPDEVTPNMIGDALEAESLVWPENLFTGEPMKESEKPEPGDFHYEPLPDHLGYCAEVYDWFSSPIGEYPPGTEGWEKCPPEDSSP